LVKAAGRGGWGVTFALNYNSQQWRQDPAGMWKLGGDVGYGFGWRLMAGSITPIWQGYWSVGFYLYTDASGAEYRLDVANADGTWSSREGVYVTYDPATNRLHFPDGSYWVMGCEAAGAEADAGTLYPTRMQDTNGNFIAIGYQAGMGWAWLDSSARMAYISDVRGCCSMPILRHAMRSQILTVLVCSIPIRIGHTPTARGSF
jgi:hypothetical protein